MVDLTLSSSTETNMSETNTLAPSTTKQHRMSAQHLLSHCTCMFYDNHWYQNHSHLSFSSQLSCSQPTSTNIWCTMNGTPNQTMRCGLADHSIFMSFSLIPEVHIINAFSCPYAPFSLVYGLAEIHPTSPTCTGPHQINYFYSYFLGLIRITDVGVNSLFIKFGGITVT